MRGIKLNELLERHSKYNERVLAGKDLSDREVINNLLVALSTEVGELANELATFKHWKRSHVIDHSKTIEEYIDVILIWLSLGNALGFTADEIEEKILEKIDIINKREDNGY